MYRNASELQDGEILSGFDVCIVGGGVAGIAMATRLIGSRVKVLVLESGVATDRGRPSGNRQELYGGAVGPFMTEVDPNFLTRSRLRMYGGTSNHFHFWARPLDEADLLPRPGYRDAYWPLPYEEIDRYYADANVFGNYGPNNYYDIPFWSKVLGGQPFPSMPGDRLMNAIFHAQQDEWIRDFQLRWGSELEAAGNVTVMFNANVLTIGATEGRDHVRGFTCSSLASPGQPRKRFQVEGARAYVLAQGGIESVRLLKLSSDLGDNPKRQLGRGFMVHPVIRRAAEVDFGSPVDSLVQNFFRYQQVFIDESEAKEKHEPVRATPIYHPESLREILTFWAWGVLAPTPHAMATEKIGNFRIMPGFSWDGRSATININWEQVPSENSVAELDAYQTDPILEQPVVRVDWNLEESDKRTIVQGLALCEGYLRARGATKFEVVTDLSGGPEHWTFSPDFANDAGLMTGDHHMGALRMSANADDGIVDPNLKMHRVDNLFAASCGVFPTSGYANPTLTLVALSLRLADHLKAQLAGQT